MRATAGSLTPYEKSQFDDEFQEFAQEYSSEIIQISTPKNNHINVANNIRDSQQLSNILNSDKKLTIEMNNCSNITFNLIQKQS